ncbi:hypothetical protein CR205_18325 [Alteribacter lacisalsi]|uniref:GerMN domain-containing protein n=1 Tax=Alteribacter lacisalsi TaxID=2045244 RepID=A0A2W0H345_9BACI|nr:hypothetical protein [Alteribacter lacisalsi]PYZ95491.1 hypothetical protein CR205_18325 [Alteribacter lacisalsi]
MTKKWDEREIEDTLHDLPPIKDRQSKEDLFAKIEERAKEEPPQLRSRKKQKPPWLYPAMASAAALFLIVLIVPSLLSNNNGDQMLTLDSSEESTSGDDAASTPAGDMAEDSGVETTEESGGGQDADSYTASDDENGNGENGVEVAENEEEETDESVASDDNGNGNGGNGDENGEDENGTEEEIRTAELESIDSENSQVTVPVPYVYTAANEEPVIALRHETVDSEDEVEERLLEKLTSEEDENRFVLPGLTGIALSENGSVELTFDETDEERYLGLSSYESIQYRQALDEVFASLGYDRIEVVIGEGEAFDFGQYGSEWHVREESNLNGYLLFDTGDDTLFVHASQLPSSDESAESFEEALEWMASYEDEGGESSFRTPFPSAEPDDGNGVIEEVELHDSGATVSFDESLTFEEENVDQYRMLRAIIYTASDFDLEFVIFDGEGAEEVRGEGDANVVVIGKPVRPEPLFNVMY